MTDTGTTAPMNRMVGFGEAISLFFKNYFQFQGRSSRGAYWWWFLVSLIITIILSILDMAIFGSNTLGVFSNLFALATLIPNIALGVRRLHDIGKSGFWLLLILIPLVGVIILIVFFVRPGQRMTNEYGPDVEAGTAI